MQNIIKSSSLVFSALAVFSTFTALALPSISLAETKPAHHTDNGFKNLYIDDDLKPGAFKLIKARIFDEPWPSEPVNYKKFWQETELEKIHNPNPNIPQATLIGHSTVLLQYKNTNILTDPIFSDYAFPIQAIGPKRYTPTSVDIQELPRIDYIVISHNHYDHLDVDSVKQLNQLKQPTPPHWYVPLGLKSWFKDLEVTAVTEMDWWDMANLKAGDEALSIQAQPSQHWSRRGMFDERETLWASWAFIWPDFTAWFGGDTGYNKVQFKEIGTVLGEVDLAMIPIGAYEPRWFMKTFHVNPEESVEIFKDINAKYAFGIHWNTFVLTQEPLDEPPKNLKKALNQSNIPVESFEAMNIGETWLSH